MGVSVSSSFSFLLEVNNVNTLLTQSTWGVQEASKMI